MDGDLVFAVSNGAKDLTDPLTDLALVGHAGALCLARAIARAIFEATAADNDTHRCWKDVNRP